VTRETFLEIPQCRKGLISNRFDVADLALFDLWANHHDHRQFVYTRHGNSKLYEAFAIDNGYLFGGPNWDMANTTRSFELWQRDSSCLIDDYLQSRITRFQKLIPALLRKGIRLVPAEWVGGSIVRLEAELSLRLIHLQAICASGLACR
jgi:hypothetical protein